ncbi:hypothetical protein GY45DRAFT_1435246 [Cubamyces sp. BRFM 1775]|nr:hypothetical protein GY45DRAFT_1435246 [Cubamyces sp. BRFM 1775]
MGNSICKRFRAHRRTRAPPEGHEQGQVSASSTRTASPKPPATSMPNSRPLLPESSEFPDVPRAKTIPMALTMPKPHPLHPPRPEFIPFTVTNLCPYFPWDGLDYMTFPERQGWLVHCKDKQCHTLCPPGFCNGGLEDDAARLYRYDVADGPASPMLSRVDGSPITSTSKAAFLQAWLFFGTLHEMSRLCGLSMDIDGEFLADGGRAISTAALNGLAGRWFASLHHENVGNKVFMQEIFTIYRHLALLLNKEVVEESGPEGSNRRKKPAAFTYTPEEARVFLSIELVLRTIGLHLLLHCYSPTLSCDESDGWSRRKITQVMEWRGRRIEGFDTLEDYADTQLEDHGWCPIELLPLPNPELFFASLLDRPRIRDHSNCGSKVCGAYQTDEATYRTAHVDATCECDFVSVSTSDLEVLRQDKIPVILISEDLNLEVVETASFPYIALSHVWADGLGNPVENALPKCQLRRLRSYVVGLYNTYYRDQLSTPEPAVAFWMDTLCVPVAEEAKAFRKQAIQLLGKTYHEATAVLVLDRELEIFNAASAPFFEIGLRILCSGWVKRLWTLQEATLASEAHGEEKIYFQMGDGPLLYQKYDRDRPAVHTVPNDTDPREVRAEERILLCDDWLMIHLGERLPSVRAMRIMRKDWSPFYVVCTAIQHRTTSKAEDVPLCVGSLLGFDISTIAHAPDGEHRLKAFYILMRVIPYSVLWVEDVEKLGIAPFRWAPVSITVFPFSAASLEPNDGRCDEEGLHVRPYSSFVVKDVVASDLQGAMPDRFRLVDSEKGLHYGALWLSRDRRAVPLPTLDRKMAIIIASPEREVMPNAAFVLISADSSSTHSDDAEITGTVIGYRFFAPERKGPEDAVVYCTPMSESQRWCIT